ncbi:MAG: zinc ribbon domain-containing protein [Chloroflexi bacterium]|nr:zinc ribbon domain-containing protein [Chloroflexota bacterium]
MPKYEFTCEECGHTFTKIMKIDERDDQQTCPECQSPKCVRGASSYARMNFHSYHFKGQVEVDARNPSTHHLGYKTKTTKWGFNQT